MIYTEQLHDYWIEDPTYFGRPPDDEPPRYAIAKRLRCVPFKAYDAETGELKTYDHTTIVIGWLVWNPKESEFALRSCGLRWLTYSPPEDVVEMVLNFVAKQAQVLLSGGAFGETKKARSQ